MNAILSFIENPTMFIIAFTIASIVLNAVAGVLQELGKQAPPWLSDALGFIGKALHFLNGNLAGVTAITSSEVETGVVQGTIAGIAAATSGQSALQAAVTAAETAAKSL